MTRRYRITVEGKTFEVEVESIDSVPTTQAIPQPQVQIAPTPPPPPQEPSAGPAMVKPVFAKNVISPIPGKIKQIAVKVGQAVAPGDLLMVIEAMKMDNEILCDVNATVAELLVKEGDSVSIGQPIVRYA
ncbi:MAG TPA: biotin/lipoyl-binding protein [Caldisericia bacterium]|jgi:glutaconyl-CoA decarboxylase|nr:MAG: 2-oxoglutarate carboxylase large subunit [bacterium ADurb.Bin132]HNW32027.1 biotin/lipoyl-binding protein [Caldisericia bacterium]HNY61061.1 biotin/lipoyl-binding protein [Caldisericia bacterium]HOC79621.1 biotin/lipoyl-binding protein [Caldisericia bacterium]HOG70071.1 biotin/lipoyl-binding protein [Caldisericia bacterium]